MTSTEHLSTVRLGEACTPEHTRLYAIGDVHGCLDQLQILNAIIENDMESRPVPTYQIIFLGDYVDRGPDSRACIQFLIDKMAVDPNIFCLSGNHEDKLLTFLNDPVRTAHSFLTYGGDQLSLSYGVTPVPVTAQEQAFINLRDRLKSAIPKEHLSFMETLPTSHVAGDYMFVHAGVMPDRALENQTDHDLMWTRAPFLNHKDPLSKVIIHGHTPHIEPEIAINRINVDTLAYDTGNLTCVALEGNEYRFLSTNAD